MKDYSILEQLIPKTQELHRAIFDKGYEQGQRDALNEIRAEIELEYTKFRDKSDMWSERACGLGRALDILDKYKAESEEQK